MHYMCFKEVKNNNKFAMLMGEYDEIMSDIDRVAEMDVSDEVKKPILNELQLQKHSVKERMHEYVNSL